MKVTQDKEFNPITVVFETKEEAIAYKDLVGYSNTASRNNISGITKVQDDILVRLWNEIDDLLG